MRKTIALLAACLVCGTGCLLLMAAEWPTDGADSKRTNWQRDEKILNKDNVKGLKILWKLQLDTVPHEMHALFPPLIVDRVQTSSGPKQVAIEAGIDDKIYAIDVVSGQVIWKKHFEYPPPAKAGRPGDPLCPTGQTATPVISPESAGGKPRIAYALAGDGKIHSLNIANGEDVIPPFQFGYPNGKSYALNLWNGIIFTTTSQGCAGNPNQIWAVKVDDPDHKVMVANPKSGGLWGREGAAVDSNGVAWAPTGDGRYDPANQVYGDGIIGARVENSALKIVDWYIPTNWIWMQKRDLDMQVTPSIFDYKGRELMVTGSKECRVFLLDTKMAGGENHQAPLDRTQLLCNDEADFQSSGIWGSMANWKDDQGTQWALNAFLGSGASRFQTAALLRPGEAWRRGGA